jgi:hypothetical protein
LRTHDIFGFNYDGSWGSSGLDLWAHHDRDLMAIEIARGKRYFPEWNTALHVVQVYATRPDPGDRFLVGCARVPVDPAQLVPVEIDVPLDRLARWQGPGRWEVTRGVYNIEVGANAEDQGPVSVAVDLG